MSENYYELLIKINPEIEDNISNICFENLSCTGIILEEQKFEDTEMIETSRGILRVFLEDLSAFGGADIYEFISEKRKEMKECGFTDDELGSWDCEIIKKETEDWSKKWKEKWDVTHITDNIAVVPSWIEYIPKPNEITISLDPGCAFGTGVHPTTQIPVRFLEKYLKPNDKTADIGTGSGILSIIAKKLGASHVYGCDIDMSAVATAKVNAVKNNTECVFELNTADNIDEKFDFVCANILHNVLDEIMGDLKSILNENGLMVLSGIMENKKEVVLSAIERENLVLKETMTQDKWVGYLVSHSA